ncbi:type 2 isopentenyl-diphosphate Delta-isomerase [Bacillus benzoevorans]|uniref:Isopentenyl-diphosphate delta-isomerase n=1 Tax=Bacillus benzoevorans TaxID=1456 RepID=A0A7X0LU88_9BACI|nr:isopentenyl-diphosphate delta-isomerase [Bacillus benzoevorans]
MSRAKRKWDHIQLALAAGQAGLTGLEDIAFIHQSLPDIGIQHILLNTKIGGLDLGSPIFINAMTGGGGEKTMLINQELSITARETGMAMAVGSQMSAIKDKTEEKTYRIIREENPRGVVIANLGGEAAPDEVKMAVEMLEADALQIHLNVIQELVMPEGDRDFTGTLKRIEKIVKEIDLPVIVKEVGFGMNKETAAQLASVGVQAVDVGGYGGTNFARIENNRRDRLLNVFNEWGIPTAVSIVEAKMSGGKMNIISSGGIQTSLDIAKSLALGADMVGIAGHFLKILIKEGLEALISEVRIIHEELTFIMTALGAKTIHELQRTPLIIQGQTHHWLTERNIDTKQYSQRRIYD